MTGQSAIGRTSGASKRSDGQYIKTILKDEIKVTKLNLDNYQSWADGIELLIDAKMLWLVVNSTKPLPNLNTKLIDHKAQKFDDVETNAWIYLNM